MRRGHGGMRLRSLYIIIALTTALAAYLISEGMQRMPSTTANRAEYLQQVLYAEKSDRIEAIKEIISNKIVRLEKYHRQADDSSKHQSYLAYYAYSEVPPDKRSADIAL